MATAALLGLLALPAPVSARVPNAARAAARAGLTALKARYPGADVVWKPGQPGAHVVLGLMAEPAGATDIERAQSFLAAHRRLVGVAHESLRHLETSRSKYRIVERFTQHYHGVPVLDRLVAVRMDHHGRVLGIVSDAMPVRSVAPARVRVSEARELAGLAAGLRSLDPARLPASRSILALPGRALPVWVVHVTSVPLRTHLRVLVDAANGKVLEIRNLVHY